MGAKIHDIPKNIFVQTLGYSQPKYSISGKLGSLRLSKKRTFQIHQKSNSFIVVASET